MRKQKKHKQVNSIWLSKDQIARHNKAWKLVELIEQFITAPKFMFLKATEIRMPEDTNPEDILKYNHALDFLISKHPEEAQLVIFKQITYSMVIDFCYFFQEALSCAKRGRAVVAYSLLRRPLVYNLIILLRIMYDESFFDKFMHDSSYDPTVYNPDELKKMLNEFDKDKLLAPISGTIIYDIIFNKENPTSIINLSNRAIHPTTTRKWNMTGEMNFNFIFAVREDITALLDTFYKNLLAILTYYFEIFNIIFLQYAPSDETESLLNTQYENLAKCLA